MGYRRIDDLEFDFSTPIDRQVHHARKAIDEGDATTVLCEDGSGNLSVVLRRDDGGVSVHECVRLGVVDDEEVADAIHDGIDPTVFGFGSLVLVGGATYPVDRLVLQGWTEGDGTSADGYRLSDFFGSDGRYLGRDQHGIEPIVGLAD